LYAEDFEQADYNEMLGKVFELYQKYILMDPQTESMLIVPIHLS
jgi:hypothetical protein